MVLGFLNSIYLMKFAMETWGKGLIIIWVLELIRIRIVIMKVEVIQKKSLVFWLK